MNYILQNLKDHAATSEMGEEQYLKLNTERKEKVVKHYCKARLKEIDKDKDEEILEERAFRRQYWEEQYKLNKPL